MSICFYLLQHLIYYQLCICHLMNRFLHCLTAGKLSSFGLIFVKGLTDIRWKVNAVVNKVVIAIWRRQNYVQILMKTLERSNFPRKLLIC